LIQDDVFLQEEKGYLGAVEGHQSGIVSTYHVKNRVQRQLYELFRFVHAKLSYDLRGLAFLRILQENQSGNDIYPQWVEEGFNVFIDHQKLIVRLVFVVYDIFVEKFEESSFSSVSNQISASESLEKGHEIVEVVRRIDVVKRPDNQRDDSFDAGFSEDMLRLAWGQEEEGENESHWFKHGWNLEITVWTCKFFEGFIIVAIDDGSEGSDDLLHDGFVVFAVVQFGEFLDDFSENVEPWAVSVPEVVVGEELGEESEGGCFGLDGAKEDGEVADVVAGDGHCEGFFNNVFAEAGKEEDEAGKIFDVGVLVLEVAIEARLH
jgi:hypothetical protein